MEVKTHWGIFREGVNVDESVLKETTERSVLKFLALLEDDGWEPTSAPHGRELRLVHEWELPKTSLTPQGGMYIPKMMWELGVLPYGHPVYELGKRHFVLWCEAQRKEKTIQMDVEDRVIADLIKADPDNERRLGL